MNQPIQKCKILTSIFFRIDQTMGVSSSQKIREHSMRRMKQAKSPIKRDWALAWMGLSINLADLQMGHGNDPKNFVTPSLKRH